MSALGEMPSFLIIQLSAKSGEQDFERSSVQMPEYQSREPGQLPDFASSTLTNNDPN